MFYRAINTSCFYHVSFILSLRILKQTAYHISTTDSNGSMSPTAMPRSSNMTSKHLIQYVPATAEKKKAASTRVTGLRVLTSAEGLAILTETGKRG